MPVTSKNYIILNKDGLHARMAARLVKLAVAEPNNNIWIENISRKTDHVNAKSLIMVLSISAEFNDEIRITIDGPDGEAVLNKITELFSTHCGEEN